MILNLNEKGIFCFGTNLWLWACKWRIFLKASPNSVINITTKNSNLGDLHHVIISYVMVHKVFINDCSMVKSHEHLLANTGKLIQNVVQNFSFPGRSTGRFLENSSINFCEYLFSFCKISGHELDRFLENSSIFGWVFQKLPCVMRHDSCPKILKLMIGWVFQKSV